MSKPNKIPLILIVDDMPAIRRSLSEILESEGYQTAEAVDGQDCLNKLKSIRPDLIILDIVMPFMTGEKVLENVKVTYPDIPVVMLSGEGDIDTAVELLHKGAFHFISKPPDLHKLLSVIRRALNIGDAAPKIKQDAPKPKKAPLVTTSVFGTSGKMQEFRNQLERLASREVRVMLTGENGTGKGFAARWLHENSARRGKPFFTINCGGLSESLLEGELFGYKKGTFTGALQDYDGKLLAAQGGTLFLDEIGNMPKHVQSRLLNVLNDNEVTRLGDNKTIKLDVRVISATNKDIQKEVELGNFFIDLYYRLAVAPVEVPPLRERKEDIERLIAVFNQEIAQKTGTSELEFLPEALLILKNKKWEGNIRELENVVQRLHAYCDDIVTATDVVKYVGK